MELGRWQDGRTEGRKTDPRKASLTHSQSPSWKPDFPLTSTPPSAMNCSYCHITYLMFQNDHKAKKDVFSFLFIPLNGITFFSINTWKIRKVSQVKFRRFVLLTKMINILHTIVKISLKYISTTNF